MEFEDVPENDKWWAGGFADGDICVYVPFSESRQQSSGVCMSIGHALLGFKTLEKWHKLFGGNVYKTREAENNRQEIWTWRQDGKAAAVLCGKLEKYSMLKREQFACASKYYDEVDDKDEYRMDIYSRLVALKRIPHTFIEDVLPVAYFSGIFDAEGSVTLTQMGSVACKIEQKYRAVCDAAARQFTCAARSVSEPGDPNACFKWQVSSDNCRTFLTAIRPFMIEKPEIADIILNSSKATIETDRAKLALLVGNQGKSTKPQLARARKRESGNELPVNISEVYIRNEADQQLLSGYQYKEEGYKIKKKARKNATMEMLTNFLTEIITYKYDSGRAVCNALVEKKECFPYGISARYHRKTSELHAYIVQLKRRHFSFSKEFPIDQYNLEDLVRLVEVMLKHVDKATIDQVKTPKSEVDRLLCEAMEKLSIA